MALLSHYYQPDIPEGIDEMAMADWIDVLREIPQQSVEGAVSEWLRNETRRPTPADLRKRAWARVAKMEKPAPGPGDPDWPFEDKKVISLELQRTVQQAMSRVGSREREFEHE